MKKKDFKLIPGPEGRFLLGNLPEMAREPVKLLMDSTMRFGSLVRFKFLKINAFLISHPEQIRYVFLENPANYKKAFTYDKLKPLLGEGLLTSAGELWKQQRRLIQPLFRQKQMSLFIDDMRYFTNQAIRDWEQHGADRVIDISEEMMKLTLNIAIKTLFSTDISKESAAVRHAFTYALEYINHKMTAIISLPAFIPTAANRQYRRSMKILEELVTSIIKDRHGREHEYSDLLSMMLLARDEESGRIMSDKQIRDEIMTIILAGHETTAHALTWTFYLLSANPEARKKARQETEGVLRGREPDFADLQQLKYLTMVIQEAMRLYPPLWIIERTNLEEDNIGGFTIPKNSLIMISPYVTQRLPEFWDEPDKFMPERFLPENSGDRPKLAYLPFGGGHRSCIGYNFAMTEAVLVLAKIMQKFELETVSGHIVEQESVITLRPKNGLKMRVKEYLPQICTDVHR